MLAHSLSVVPPPFRTGIRRHTEMCFPPSSFGDQGLVRRGYRGRSAAFKDDAQNCTSSRSGEDSRKKQNSDVFQHALQCEVFQQTLQHDNPLINAIDKKEPAPQRGTDHHSRRCSSPTYNLEYGGSVSDSCDPQLDDDDESYLGCFSNAIRVMQYLPIRHHVAVPRTQRFTSSAPSKCSAWRMV